LLGCAKANGLDVQLQSSVGQLATITALARVKELGSPHFAHEVAYRAIVLALDEWPRAGRAAAAAALLAAAAFHAWAAYELPALQAGAVSRTQPRHPAVARLLNADAAAART
jgi:hypothetical protein